MGCIICTKTCWYLFSCLQSFGVFVCVYKSVTVLTTFQKKCQLNWPSCDSAGGAGPSTNQEVDAWVLTSGGTRIQRHLGPPREGHGGRGQNIHQNCNTAVCLVQDPRGKQHRRTHCEYTLSWRKVFDFIQRQLFPGFSV